MTFPQLRRSFACPNNIPTVFRTTISMQLSLKEAWTRILDDVRKEVPEKDFKAWFEPAKPVALDGDRLVLGVPDEFAVQWNEAKHTGLVARHAERALGHPVAIVFRVDEERLARPQMDFFVAPPQAAVPASAPNPSAQPLNERYTFENGAKKDYYNHRGGYQGTIAEKREAMEIDWMGAGELNQAIPPAYTQFIGEQLMEHLRKRVGP